MNIIVALFRRVIGRPTKKKEIKSEPPTMGDHFPRPVSVTMKATTVIREPDKMAQAIANAKRDAKKTAVQGRVAIASRSETRPVDPWLDPLSPLNPLNQVYQDDARTVGHRHHEDTTAISDSVRSSVVTHVEPVHHHDHGSSHDSSPSYDSSPSNHDNSNW